MVRPESQRRSGSAAYSVEAPTRSEHLADLGPGAAHGGRNRDARAISRLEHIRVDSRLSRTYHSSSGSRLNTVRTPSLDRKSTRLNSSHLGISYAVFCLKKKKKMTHAHIQQQSETQMVVTVGHILRVTIALQQ